MTQVKPQRVRFADYELDFSTRRLYKNGEPVELQSKGFAFLATLVQRPGETISRFELANQLWPGVYVQVDQGLNAAVRKVRRALNDDAFAPRYVQTVGSHGYRFICEVKPVEID